MNASPTEPFTLYGYFRSSAAWRVRLALDLKRVPFTTVPVHLLKEGGRHRQAAFGDLNPERLLPMLDTGHARLTQSLAILEYLEETYPEPALLPADPIGRAWVRAVGAQVACDIHPINNLRVMQHLEQSLHVSAEDRTSWSRHWIQAGFDAIESRLQHDGHTGSCCFGDAPTLADCCLVPQVFNARRVGVDLTPYPTIVSIDAQLAQHPSFQRAHPSAQIDAE